MNIEKDFEKFVEEVELEEEFWVVIDTAKKGEVMAVSSDEKGARDSVKSSTTSKYDYHYGKDPKTLKVVKVKGKHSQKKAEKMIGTKLSEDLENEADTYRKKKYAKKSDKQFGISRKKSNVRHGGTGYGEEIDESTAKYAKSLEKIANDKALKMLSKSERENLKKIAALLSKEKTLGEAYKDLPPHLQKLIKKIEKKQKDWNKQNPNAKIKTLVYNPETGKPDIEVKENMDLKDTIKKVIEDNSNDKSDDGDGLDKVQPKAVKKKFKDRKDKDIDNDGDVDSSDKFLHKKRKAISKAMSKEQKSFSKMFSHVKSLMQGK